LNGRGVEGEEGASVDGFWGGPVGDQAGYRAVDCFCGLGQNSGLMPRGMGVWDATFSV
jgi:hypothetical protein